MPIPSAKQVQDLKECRSIVSSLIPASANGTSHEAGDVVMTNSSSEVRTRSPEGLSPRKRAMELILLV